MDAEDGAKIVDGPAGERFEKIYGRGVIACVAAANRVAAWRFEDAQSTERAHHMRPFEFQFGQPTNDQLRVLVVDRRGLILDACRRVHGTEAYGLIGDTPKLVFLRVGRRGIGWDAGKEQPLRYLFEIVGFVVVHLARRGEKS